MTTAIAGRAGHLRRRRHTSGALVAGLVALLALSTLIVHLTMPSWYARWWYPMEHGPSITAEAAATGVAPDLIAAVIYRESKYAENARSDHGAVGLMQVLPETAQWIHRQPAAPAAEPERLAEPAVNIAYGAWYLQGRCRACARIRFQAAGWRRNWTARRNRRSPRIPPR